ncbi:MAG: methyltransferase domain-containing protein [Alphaproteobacteria bacterium]|nr:methyltransferase domain-containing protein [Alphaproteobacteria bacterium]
MADDDSYFEYLRRRSVTGLIYRKGWLYPRLCRYLDGKVLDIGCGLGDMLSYRSGTVGVDINRKTVEWCQRQGLDAHLMSKDVLPFSDGGFDGVIMDNVLEHLEDPSALLKDVARVLVPGGKLLVGVPGSRGFASDPDHKVFYDKDKLLHLMKESGFSKHKIFYMPLHLEWLDNHMRQYCLYGVFRKK